MEDSELISELDRLRTDYKAAVEQWIAAIREEEALATPDHSVRAWDRWEKAGFAQQEAQEAARLKREAYTDGLRRIDFDI